MKFLDANIFLRFLADPRTEEDKARQEACSRLFDDVENGRAQATTSHVVVHEVLFVMCSPRQYGLTNADAEELLRVPLTFRNLHLPDKALILDSMALFASHEFLDFSDALMIALAQRQGDDIFTYDEGFDRVPGVTRFEP